MGFEQIEQCRNALLDVDLPPVLPQAFADLHRTDGHRMHHGLRGMIQIDHTLLLPTVSRRKTGRGTQKYDDKPDHWKYPSTFKCR